MMTEVSTTHITSHASSNGMPSTSGSHPIDEDRADQHAEEWQQGEPTDGGHGITSLGREWCCSRMRRRAKARSEIERRWQLDQRRRSNVSFEGFKNHQPELWRGLERPDLDRIEVVIEIVRQRIAPDDKAAGEPQPLTVLAYRVDQFIHTVAQALAGVRRRLPSRRRFRVRNSISVQVRLYFSLS